MINVSTKDPSEKKKRTEQATEALNVERQNLRETEANDHLKLVEARSELKKSREDFKAVILGVVDEGRSTYKVGLQDSMD